MRQSKKKAAAKAAVEAMPAQAIKDLFFQEVVDILDQTACEFDLFNVEDELQEELTKRVKKIVKAQDFSDKLDKVAEKLVQKSLENLLNIK